MGAISIEADVWLINSTLFVGHDQLSLSASRTLSSLYIEPLISILEAQNPFIALISDTHNGVHDTAPGQTFYLFVDLKRDGSTTWPAVVAALDPLRTGGWLTSVQGVTVTAGAVRVVGTGKTPLDLVQSVNQRDYF